MALNLDDLLNALQNPNKPDKPTLERSKATWERIGNKDAFSELGLESSELENFLREWMDSNPYNSI